MWKGDARLEFVRDGRKCDVKFFDADVKRPLASVSATVDEGKHCCVRTTGVVHREHGHWPEDSDEEAAWRVCGAAGRTSGYEIDEDGEI